MIDLQPCKGLTVGSEGCGVKPGSIRRFLEPRAYDTSKKDSDGDRGQQRRKCKQYTSRVDPGDPHRHPLIAGSYRVGEIRNVSMGEIRRETVHTMTAMWTIVHLL